MRSWCFVGLLALLASPMGAEERAWQQRLDLQVPVVVPLETVRPVNPLAALVDAPPRLQPAPLPEDFDVSVTTELAAYVDAEGRCRSVVPLGIPFPGAMGPLVEDVLDTRFEPARRGDEDVPSWVVLGVMMETSVERGRLVDATLELLDSEVPPRVTPPASPAVSERLASLPATPVEDLTVSAVPKRLRIRVPSYQCDVGVRLLIHVTPEGRCDRYVPLDLSPGMSDWMIRVIRDWRFEPAQRDNEPVGTWMLFQAQYSVELDRMKSRGYRVYGSRAFTPAAAPAGETPPAQ